MPMNVCAPSCVTARLGRYPVIWTTLAHGLKAFESRSRQGTPPAVQRSPPAVICRSSKINTNTLVAVPELDLSRIVSLIDLWDGLLPKDRARDTVAMRLWSEIEALAPAHRCRLIDSLSASDIVCLWHLSGQHSYAPSVNPPVTLHSLMLDSPEKITTFQAIAALPTMGTMRLRHTFQHDPDSQQLVGRLMLGTKRRPYPLPCQAHVGRASILGGREECELTLAYVADEDHAAGETCPLYRSGLAFGRQFGPGCVVLQAYLAEKVHRSCWPPWHVVMIREA